MRSRCSRRARHRPASTRSASNDRGSQSPDRVPPGCACRGACSVGEDQGVASPHPGLTARVRHVPVSTPARPGTRRPPRPSRSRERNEHVDRSLPRRLGQAVRVGERAPPEQVAPATLPAGVAGMVPRYPRRLFQRVAEYFLQEVQPARCFDRSTGGLRRLGARLTALASALIWSSMREPPRPPEQVGHRTHGPGRRITPT